MKAFVPTRPAGDFTLSEAEKDALTWYVLSGCSKLDAFGTFVHPELKVSKVALNGATQQFFSNKEVIDYIEAYREMLTNNKPKVEKVSIASAEDRKRLKEEALQKLMDYVIEQSLNIDTVEDKESIVKLADKLGLLGDEEEVDETPRRYLPETCGNCRYKKFIEENCEEV